MNYSDTWEEEDSTAHFIAQCTALMLLRKNILGEYILSLDTLCSIHWILLLKFAKASKRFYWPCSLSGLRMLWPQRWVPAHAATHPAGIVRENVWNTAKKRKKSHFLDCEKNVKNVEVITYRSIGLKTTVTTFNRFCCPSRNYQGHMWGLF